MSEKPAYDFDALYQKHNKQLNGIAQQQLKDKSKAADVVQDVFSVLYENLIAGNPIQNMTSWLIGVTLNKARETQRKDKRSSRVDVNQQLDADGSEEPLYLYDIIRQNEYLTENEIHRAYLKERIEQAIEGLPQEQQWVFIQHEIEGRSFKELEVESGVALKTLLSRKHYAVKRLKEELEEVYIELIKN